MRLPQQAIIFLKNRVYQALSARKQSLSAMQKELQELQKLRQQLHQQLSLDQARLSRTPFQASDTVHAAHRRHPGVQAVFARAGLPACPHCAVGNDETLAEAALGEKFALEPLLEQLNALIV